MIIMITRAQRKHNSLLAFSDEFFQEFSVKAAKTILNLIENKSLWCANFLACIHWVINNQSLTGIHRIAAFVVKSDCSMWLLL